MASGRATLFKPSLKLHKFVKKSIIFLLATAIITITISLVHRNEHHGPSKVSKPDSNLENSLKIFCSATQDPGLCFTSISTHFATTNNTAVKESAGPDEVFTASKVSKPDSNLENSLKIFCSETQDPGLCFTSISTHFATNNNTAVKEPARPDEIFTASLQVAIRNISSLPPMAKFVLAGSTKIGAQSALDQCNMGVNESLSRLNDLLSRIRNSFGEFSYEGLTSEKREDLVNWLIRGMSGLEICVELLDELGSEAVNNLSVKVYKARVQLRNSVDFLICKDAILDRIMNNDTEIEFAHQESD